MRSDARTDGSDLPRRRYGARPLLSIVMPAYNEEKRIGLALLETMRYLNDQGWSYEIIVVDDGSADATSTVVQRVVRGMEDTHDAPTRDNAAPCPTPRVRLLRNERNRGKGYSVRRGMLEARGVYVGFADADYKTHVESIEEAVRCLRSGCDGAIGSRALSESRIELEQPGHRRGGSRIFNGMLRAILGMKRFGDTQCGFKFFRCEVAQDLFRRQRIEGYMFDVEVLWLCERLGHRIQEIPVRWTNDPDSRFRIVSGMIRNLQELLRIRLRSR